MTTQLKSVFIEHRIKKIIELEMSLNNFSGRSLALENLLKESPRYNELVKMMESFNNPQNSNPMDSGDDTPKEKPDFVDLTKKSVEELIK